MLGWFTHVDWEGFSSWDLFMPPCSMRYSTIATAAVSI
jgi:hypothetical protein